MTDKDIYTLQVGLAGKERLDILNQIYNPSSQQFLLNSGLAKGMHVLEIGGGTGEIACWLAMQVGQSGKVTMIDNSEEQLSIAKENAYRHGINNIEFLVLDIKNLNHLHHEFDFIYSRWLLMHLQQPLEALQLMYGSLKPGGILTCEDGAKEGCFCYPENEIFNLWLAAWEKRFIYYNKDYNSGLKLYSHFQQLNCRLIKCQLYQPLLITHNEKKLLPLNVQESSKAIIDCGYLSPAETEDLIKKLEKLTLSHHIIGYLRNMQIAAYKL